MDRCDFYLSSYCRMAWVDSDFWQLVLAWFFLAWFCSVMLWVNTNVQWHGLCRLCTLDETMPTRGTRFLSCASKYNYCFVSVGIRKWQPFGEKPVSEIKDSMNWRKWVPLWLMSTFMVWQTLVLYEDFSFSLFVWSACSLAHFTLSARFNVVVGSDHNSTDNQHCTPQVQTGHWMSGCGKRDDPVSHRLALGTVFSRELPNLVNPSFGGFLSCRHVISLGVTPSGLRGVMPWNNDRVDRARPEQRS